MPERSPSTSTSARGCSSVSSSKGRAVVPSASSLRRWPAPCSSNRGPIRATAVHGKARPPTLESVIHLCARYSDQLQPGESPEAECLPKHMGSGAPAPCPLRPPAPAGEFAPRKEQSAHHVARTTLLQPRSRLERRQQGEEDSAGRRRAALLAPALRPQRCWASFRRLVGRRAASLSVPSFTANA